MAQTVDVLVLGAGAAGLMCAIEAGKRGRKVIVLEANTQPGKKILISGGGRCNFTNLHCQPHHFISENPHFAKSALARYSPGDFVALMEKHGIPYHEKKLGQLFCDRSAQDLLALLLAECRAAGVEIVLNTKVASVQKDAGFAVTTAAGEWRAEAVVVAAGGLSIPKIGATGIGYEIARQFGLRIVPCRPALVPFTFSAEERAAWCDLAGLSFQSVAKANGQQFQEKTLVTHRGLSGPAVLQISSYWKPGESVAFELKPEDLPQRFLKRWQERNPPPDDVWAVTPAGTEGYDKAEVTAGGVDTNELSSKTMEARRVPGLYFIGEVVDVTGHLGGFNFQWAWASAYAAGQVA